MKNFNKLISALSALAISASLMPMNIMAETLPETVWYENTFDNGTADLTWETDSEYFDGGYNTDSIPLVESVIDGNKGIKSNNSGAYKVKQTFFYDFKKGGENEALNTGKLKFSFDFKMRETSTADAVGVGINMSEDGADPTHGNLAMQLDRVTGEDGVTLGRIRTKEHAASYNCDDAESKTDTFDLKDVHTLEIILNLNNNDNARFNYYLDGERIGNNTRFWGVNVSNLALALSGQFEYVDNIKLSMLNADSAYSFTADAKYANGYVDVDFGAAMDVAKGTFTVDGETADSVDWLDLNTARVYSEALNEGGTHTVTVAEAKDLYGVAPQNTEASVMTEELLPEEVLYYNTFDNGAASVDWKTWQDFGEFEGLLKKKGNAINPPITATFEGNNGIRGAAGQYPTATQFCFDFTKSGTKSAINSGTYKFSWDFSLGGNTDGCDNNFSGFNMTSTWEGNMLVQYRADQMYLLEYGNWSTLPQDLDADKVHSIDIIADFDANLIYYYINGELKYTRTHFEPAMKTFDINFCQCIDFFDNLKVSRINKGMEYTYVPTVETELANGYVDVTFPAWMDTTKGSFAIDYMGAEFEWTNASTVRIYSDALNCPGEHTVTLSGVEDNFGVAPRLSEITFEICSWDDEYVLYESTFDNGNADLYWTEENPAFTGGYNATKLEDAKNPIGGLKPASAAFGGNKGIGYHDSAWPSGSTFWFDFTKGGTQAAPTSGKMKFSFDFIMQKSTDLEGSSFIKNSPNNTSTSSWSGGGFIYKNEKPYIVTWDDSGSNYIRYTDVDKFGTELDYEIHTLDIVIDHGDYAYLNYYLDGVKMPKVFNYWTSANSFGFAMSGVLKYVDNVKLSYIKDGSFGVESLKTPTAGDNTLTLYTTEQAQALTTEDVLVTVNGEAVTPTAVAVKTFAGSLDNNSRYAVEVTLPEAVVEGFEYEVALASTVKSEMGFAVNSAYNSAKAEAKAEVEYETGLVVEDGVAKAVIVNDTDKAITPVLMVAEYDEEGRFTGLKTSKGYQSDGFGIKEIPAGEAAIIEYDLSAVSDNAKVMLVGGIDTMKPLVESVDK